MFRQTFTLVTVLLLPMAVPPTAAATDLEVNKAVVRQVIEEMLNQGRFDRAEEMFARNGDIGPEWFRTTYRVRRTVFPDLTYRIEEMIAEGDRVVVRFTTVGTPNGPAAPAPGETPVEVPGVAIFRLAAGKIVQGWELTDMLKLVRETGYTLQAPQAGGQ